MRVTLQAMHTLPPPAIALMERQHSVIGRFQLRRWLSYAVIDGLVRHGHLVTIERGIYRRPGSAETPEQRVMAAVLRARPGARATGPFVLGALGIDGFSVHDPFEILTAPGRRLCNVSFPHRRNPTPDDPRVFASNIPIPGAVPALVDSARFRDEIGDRRLRLGFDVFRWRNVAPPEHVLARARLLGPRDAGAAFFLDWHDTEGLVAESEGERDMDRALAGFRPAPESQVPVLTYRIDKYWRLYRLGAEYLGSVDHAYAEARLKDSRRFRELRDAGIKLLPVVAADLEDVEAFRAWVRAALTLRAVELGLPPPRTD